ncbi:hypothetical protein [Colwellia sp. BRX10-4]|jgi:hypothetical protein|uniref:hypothetical protein n=1 Tax=Colwellia sp. BRX10-4 TaxID=2759843 RepID=UPI0015F4280B|nr:hypothetical protein [Colwellia sp. BRX10-4]MBA6397597.1 hypothetical protein [Colwellia sp. BRX10-4]
MDLSENIELILHQYIKDELMNKLVKVFSTGGFYDYAQRKGLSKQVNTNSVYDECGGADNLKSFVKKHYPDLTIESTRPHKVGRNAFQTAMQYLDKVRGCQNDTDLSKVLFKNGNFSTRSSANAAINNYFGGRGNLWFLVQNNVSFKNSHDVSKNSLPVFFSNLIEDRNALQKYTTNNGTEHSLTSPKKYHYFYAFKQKINEDEKADLTVKHGNSSYILKVGIAEILEARLINHYKANILNKGASIFYIHDESIVSTVETTLKQVLKLVGAPTELKLGTERFVVDTIAFNDVPKLIVNATKSNENLRNLKIKNKVFTV